MVVIRSRERGIEIRKNPAARSMQLPARIDIGQGRLLHGVIDDLSDLGARITLAIVAKLPREFVLVLKVNGNARRRCRTLWRDELELGVEFLPNRPEDSIAIVELND
jgi:hypothetical protein